MKITDLCSVFRLILSTRGSVHQRPAPTLTTRSVSKHKLIINLINKSTSPHVLVDIIKYHFES